MLKRSMCLALLAPFFSSPEIVFSNEPLKADLEMRVRDYKETYANAAFRPTNLPPADILGSQLWLISFDDFGFMYLVENGKIFPERTRYRINVWEGSAFPIRFGLAWIPEEQANEIQALFSRDENRAIDENAVEFVSDTFCLWESYRGDQGEPATIKCGLEGQMLDDF